MEHLLAKNMKGVADNAEILQTFSLVLRLKQPNIVGNHMNES